MASCRYGPAIVAAAMQAIIREMEQSGNVTEVFRLKKIDPQTAMQTINQLFGGDPTGRTSTGGLRVSAPTRLTKPLRSAARRIALSRPKTGWRSWGDGRVMVPETRSAE